jgi:hypothetical protein
LEYLPKEDRLLVRAGVGWKPGVIDNATLGADLESPAGYAYQTGNAVISNHLQEETRFRTPQLFADHGVRRAINVLIERGGEDNGSFGVLEGDSSDQVSSTKRMQISFIALRDFSALPSSGSTLMPCFKRPWTTRPCLHAR